MTWIPVCSPLENLQPVEAIHLAALLIDHASAWVFYENGKRQRAEDFLKSPCEIKIAGVMLHPPEKDVTYLCQEVCDLLQKKRRTMVLYIDGLGYAQYHRNKKFMPHLASEWEMICMATVYPPLTNSAMASMLTGVQPYEHGVHSHRDHRLLRPTFLDTALQLGRKVEYVEGDAVILQTEVFPHLNPVAEASQTDEVVFHCAMKAAVERPDLLLVHFHGLDDLAHEGKANMCAGKLTELDMYIHSLCEAFSGQAILISDHGSHAEGKARIHGVFDCEDLMVPYGRWQGKEGQP